MYATCACQPVCLQVPVLVQSTLADAADDLVRLVNRQWAVHARMTAGTASGTGTVTRTDSSSIRVADSADGKQPVRLQPVKLEGVTAAPARPAAVGQQVTSEGPVQQQEGGNTGQASPKRSGDGGVPAVTAGGQATGVTSAGSRRSAVKAVVPQPAAPEALSSPSKPVLANGPAGSQGAVCPSGALSDAEAGAAAAEAAASSSSPAVVIDEFLSAQMSACRQAQDGLQGQEVASSITAAAEAAAQRLLSGVNDGRFSMGEVEQQLLQALQHVQAAVQAAHTSAAGSAHAVTADGRQQLSAAQYEEHLLLLLAGALVHTLLCCPRAKAAVWATACTAHAQCVTVAAACPALPYLTQLPVQVMKAVRGDVPVWLLKALRHWLQSGTLLSVQSSVK